MLVFAEIPIGTGGVLPCVRCGSSAETTVRPLADVAADLASRAAECDGVWFTGFEPFAHPELPALIAAARAAGYTRIGLRSDAGALAQAGNAAGALAVGVRLLEVVLLGSSPSAHDALAGTGGLFAAAHAGAHAFTASAELAGAVTALTVRVRACRHSSEDLPATVATAAALGASSVVIDASAAPDSARPMLLAALDTAALNRMSACVVGKAGYAAPLDRAPWAVA